MAWFFVALATSTFGQAGAAAFSVDDFHLHVRPLRHAARALSERQGKAGVADARIPGELHLDVDAAGGLGVVAVHAVVQQNVDRGDAVR